MAVVSACDRAGYPLEPHRHRYGVGSCTKLPTGLGRIVITTSPVAGDESFLEAGYGFSSERQRLVASTMNSAQIVSRQSFTDAFLGPELR
jgi:hypothetical protein